MAKTIKKVEKTKNLFEALQEIVVQEKFKREDLVEVLEAALIAAYRKKYKTTEGVSVLISENGEHISVVAKKIVVDNVLLPGMQIHIDEAVKIDPSVQLGDKIDVKEDPNDYGRVSAQTAIYVASQKLKLLEQERIKNEFSGKLGELLNGYILRKRGDTVYLDLGNIEAIMPVKHQIPGERYRVEDKVKVILHDIEEDRSRVLKVIVSRAEKKFVEKLFEMEVPEIYENSVEIVAIGRVPGIRCKVVVKSNVRDVDPVGACVGIHGVRIQSIVRELGTERIDIVNHSTNAKEFIKNAISPATPIMVKADPLNRQALVVVSDKELSIAIGKEGSNVKIASHITGFKIDLKSESEFSQEIISPEARKNFEKLFSDEEEGEEEEDGTSLSQLPGLTKRVVAILKQNQIRFVEDLISLKESDLIAMEDVGESTARKIMQVISDNIEFEDDGESDIFSEEAAESEEKAEEEEGKEGDDQNTTE